MKIRKATKKDLKPIIALLNSDPNMIGDDKFEYKPNWVMEYLTNPVYKTFVYEEEGKVIGVLVNEFWPKAKYVHLLDGIVDKEYRKKGIATALRNYVEKLAKKQGFEITYCYSEEDNIKTHKLLKKGGYEKGKKFVFFTKELK